jgi:phage FluMu protein Com
LSKETEESENLLIEKIEIAGDIIDEPVLSKSIRELKHGSKHRKISVGPFFCECGKTITKENAVRCSHCRKLLCRECGILYLDEIHCKKCLKTNHNIFLTKTDYMILLCVSNGVEIAKRIFRLTGVKPEVVEKRIQDLMEKYVTREPSSFLERLFPKLRLTDLGQDALGVFDAIYAKDADCINMKEKLLKFLAERAELSYSLRVDEEDTTCSNQESSKS